MTKFDPNANQLDFFDMPPPSLARALQSDDVAQAPYVPKEGPAEYKAAQEMIHFIVYSKLGDWQKKVLWPHLRNIIEDRMPYITDEHQLKFELGYVVGTLEVEQLRSRNAARDIAEKYGITFK